MNNSGRRFSSDELLNILSLSHNATAIYTTEQLIIQTANNAMIRFWGKDNSIIGKTLEDAVPELEGQPFIDLLKNVWRTGITYEAVDTPAKLNVDGELKVFYFDFVYRAIKNEQGEIYCILHTAVDVTERNINLNLFKDVAQREQQLNEELTATNEELASSQYDLLQLNQQLEQRIESRTKALAKSEARLINMVMTTPIGMTVLRGRDLVVETANQYILSIWARTAEEVSGKRLMDIFPELVDQPFPKMLAEVFDTGKKVALPEIAAVVGTAEGDRNIFVNFSYDPLFDADGNVDSILVTVLDITEVVKTRKVLEQSEAEQQALNEELSATNEELAASNEELVASNEELAEIQQSLTGLYVELSESEAKFRTSVLQAPVAIGVLNTRDLIVESANEQILKIWGKTSAISGLPIAVAIPELQGQPYLQLLDDVFTSGEAYYGNEARVMLEYNGELKEGFFDFIYQPIKNEVGQSEAIMVVATEVTGQVNDRKKLQKAEEMLRMALEAANIGTWSINSETRELITTPRLREIFGYDADKEMTYAEAIGQVSEEYRDKIVVEIEKAITQGGHYDFIYTMNRFNDSKLIWLRSSGRLSQDGAGNLSSFAGVVMDITEQKQDELRKNDFIGMVSHELKTPLTSLSAIVQMLSAKARRSDDNFSAGALDKAYNQAKKMSAMINGFLNISRLESGKIYINKQQFKLDSLVREMIEETQLTITSHNIILKIAEPIIIDADRDKIGSVISNLLSNASKYSDRGTTITVTCNINDGKAQVSVTDAGIGIKQQDIEKLFDRYYRVENKDTQHISGFGIGLYLSAEIIQRHNGTIWVESEMDKGSTFYFSLPLR